MAALAARPGGGGDVDVDDLDAAAADVPPGCDGVVVLPHLVGERAPSWTALPAGVVFGLRFEHGRGHLARAGMEGVAHQLRQVTDALADVGLAPDRLRATGGFTNSAVWTRTVADVLEVPLELPRVTEAVAFGAALLGMVAVGLLDGLDAVGDLVAVEDRRDAGTADRAVHRAVHARFTALEAALADPYRQLADDLDGDRPREDHDA